MAPKQAAGRASRAKPAVQRPSRRAAPKKETIPAKGGTKAISFKPGGLHSSLGVPKRGPKAAAQARFAKNVLTGKKKGK